MHETSDTVSHFETSGFVGFDVARSTEDLGDYSSEVTSQSLVLSSDEASVLPICIQNVNFGERSNQKGKCSPVGLSATAVT